MIKYNAQVIHTNENIEEEVTLRVNGYELTCFANICPYEIILSKIYPVIFGIDDYDVCIQNNSKETNMRRIGDGYAYEIKGKIMFDTIDAGIQIYDEQLAYDYKYLNNEYVCLNTERLNVEFL